jgi:hypothetical protein
MPRFYINYGAQVMTSGVDAEDRPKALGAILWRAAGLIVE